VLAWPDFWRVANGARLKVQLPLVVHLNVCYSGGRHHIHFLSGYREQVSSWRCSCSSRMEGSVGRQPLPGVYKKKASTMNECVNLRKLAVGKCPKGMVESLNLRMFEMVSYSRT
jgi:hypothetical protein